MQNPYLNYFYLSVRTGGIYGLSNGCCQCYSTSWNFQLSIFLPIFPVSYFQIDCSRPWSPHSNKHKPQENSYHRSRMRNGGEHYALTPVWSSIMWKSCLCHIDEAFINVFIPLLQRLPAPWRRIAYQCLSLIHCLQYWNLFYGRQTLEEVWSSVYHEVCC